RASGLEPCFCAADFSMSTTAAAASLMPEALPAVTVPSFLNTVFSFCRSASVASLRSCSSTSNRAGPFLAFTSTGTIWLLKCPASIALGAGAERDVGIAEQDVLSRRDDRLQPAAAQAIDRQAGRADREPSFDRCDARDVHVARVAVDHAAEYDVPDRRRVDLRPRHRIP